LRTRAEDAFLRALGVLKGNSTPRGLKASAAYYNQVWARDSFISFLGSNPIHDKALLECARSTVETFAKTRASLGQIANFYDLSSGQPEFGWSGSTDSSSWYIIGLASLYHATGDRGLLGFPLEAALDAYRFLRYQDANNSWLIDSPQGADWMDAAIQRTGKTLYNNVLFLASTKCLAALLSSAGKPIPGIVLDYDKLKERFNDVFLPKTDTSSRVSLYWPRLAEYLTKAGLASEAREHYLQYISFARVDARFDTLSNLLCGLFGVAERQVFESIVGTVEKRMLASPYPVRVLDPPYRSGDPGYDDSFDATLPVQHRSVPYSYHNGAVWPFVGGFYVCSLATLGRDAPGQLDALAGGNMVLKEGESVGFNEWLDGTTGEAKGQYGQSWNAGMYVGAYSALKGSDPFEFLR
jgi:glycogen debranching enzyme